MLSKSVLICLPFNIFRLGANISSFSISYPPGSAAAIPAGFSSNPAIMLFTVSIKPEYVSSFKTVRFSSLILPLISTSPLFIDDAPISNDNTLPIILTCPRIKTIIIIFFMILYYKNEQNKFFYGKSSRAVL